MIDARPDLSGRSLWSDISFSGLLAYDLTARLRIADRMVRAVLIEPSPPSGAAGWLRPHRVGRHYSQS